MFARPLKWTMLARNQIINAHTENWVLRYLSYETIEKDEERKLWEDLFDMNYKGDCGDEASQMILVNENDDHSELKKIASNRLGMFFSTSTNSIYSKNPVLNTSASPVFTEFDLFLARHNKHYARNDPEYSKRKIFHDQKVKKIETWNKEHEGKTTFTPNEFLDMHVKEMMAFRGGHIPRSSRRDKKKLGQQVKPSSTDAEAKRTHLRLVNPPEENEDADSGTSSNSSDDNEDGDYFTEYEVPKDFDTSTLPKEFDWREHLPGSVGPIKDQGFCGS